MSEPLGKKFPGDQFAQTTTPEAVAADLALQGDKSDPAVIRLETYLDMAEVRDPTRRAMMSSYTPLRRATFAEFAAVFATF